MPETIDLASPEMSGVDLVSCIALAQANFGSLPRDQHASIRSDKANYEYDYISEAALMARTREVLSPMGVAVLTSCEKVEPSAGGVWITVRVSFHKGAENLSVTGMAQGLDRADKAYNKAITTATRIILGKLFLQGGDIDPEKTINEPPNARSTQARMTLSNDQIRTLMTAAIDAKVTLPDGGVDPQLLLRIASFAGGEKVDRVDAIPVAVFDKLIDRTLAGYAANPTIAEQKMGEAGW